MIHRALGPDSASLCIIVEKSPGVSVPRDVLLHMHTSYTVSACKISHTEDIKFTPKSSPDSGVLTFVLESLLFAFCRCELTVRRVFALKRVRLPPIQLLTVLAGFGFPGFPIFGSSGALEKEL